MLKDLIQSLQQGTNQIKARLMEGQEVAGYYGAASVMPPSNKSGGRPVGKQGLPAGKLGSFLKAIAEQESGGNYGAVNSGSGALGKYQIMPGNISGDGGWDKEVLGRNISTQQFLSNPRLQEKIARGKLTEYFNNWGPAGAAKAWYAGPGNWDTNSDASQSGGPSINDYAAQVLSKMRKR